MLSLFKIESYFHLILFSQHEEIIEHSYSLRFPRERTAIVILNTLRPKEAILLSLQISAQVSVNLVS